MARSTTPPVRAFDAGTPTYVRLPASEETVRHVYPSAMPTGAAQLETARQVSVQTVESGTAPDAAADTTAAVEPTTPQAAGSEPPVATAPPPAAAPAATAGTAAHLPSAAELDEMAKRLYEPLTARLRAELWLDRERAGLVTERRW